jgi:hypothetical protein
VPVLPGLNSDQLYRFVLDESKMHRIVYGMVKSLSVKLVRNSNIR